VDFVISQEIGSEWISFVWSMEVPINQLSDNYMLPAWSNASDGKGNAVVRNRLSYSCGSEILHHEDAGQKAAAKQKL
jgi:hypothetical protein